MPPARTSSRCLVANDSRVPPPEPAIAAQPVREPGAAGFSPRSACGALTAWWALGGCGAVNAQCPSAPIAERRLACAPLASSCTHQWVTPGGEQAAHSTPAHTSSYLISGDGGTDSAGLGAARGWRPASPCGPVGQPTTRTCSILPTQHACSAAAAAPGGSGAAAAASTACGQRWQ